MTRDGGTSITRWSDRKDAEHAAAMPADDDLDAPAARDRVLGRQETGGLVSRRILVDSFPALRASSEIDHAAESTP